MPHDWEPNRPTTLTPTTRRRILNRDHHTCQINGPHCTHTATEVDHITPTAEGGPNTDVNLRAVCHTCHREKSQTEAARGRARARARALMPREPHPGLRPNPPHRTNRTNHPATPHTPQGGTPSPGPRRRRKAFALGSRTGLAGQAPYGLELTAGESTVPGKVSGMGEVDVEVARQRVREAAAALAECDRRRAELMEARNSALRAARAAGVRWVDMQADAGLSVAGVQKILAKSKTRQQPRSRAT